MPVPANHRLSVVLCLPRSPYPSGDIPLGLASIGACLRERFDNLELSVLDGNLHPSPEYARSHLERHQPAVALIYANTIMFPDALRLAREARKSGAFVVLGGPHPTILPEVCLADPAVDAVGIGEGEATTLELVDRFINGRSPDDIPGLWLRRGDAVIRNPNRPLLEDLDLIPFPAVDLFDTERYLRRFVQLDSLNPRLRGMSIIVSRGCPFGCTYCQPALARILGPRVRFRTPPKVVEDLRRLKERFRLDAVYFQDDTLTVSRDWMAEFCTLMIEQRPGLVWACNTRADTVDRDTLAMMHRAGCVKIKIGIESITDRIRDGLYRKHIPRKSIDALLAECREIGIQTAGFFMLGAPGERIGEAWNTIRFAAGSPLAEANFSVTTPLPGTELYRMARDEGWNLPEECGSFDYYQVRRARLASGDMHPLVLSLLKKAANVLFYGHPRRVGRTFAQVVDPRVWPKLPLKLSRV